MVRWSNPHFLHEVVRCEGFKLNRLFAKSQLLYFSSSQLNQVFIPRNNCDLVVLADISAKILWADINSVCFVMLTSEVI